MDGIDALSDAHHGPGQHRNELACTGLQSETRDGNTEHEDTDESNGGLNEAVFEPVKHAAIQGAVAIRRKHKKQVPSC